MKLLRVAKGASFERKLLSKQQMEIQKSIGKGKRRLTRVQGTFNASADIS